MLLKILLYLFFSALICLSNGQKEKKFFRKDYTYLETTEAFYKFHSLRDTWYAAKKTCAREGATLFYPDNDSEAKDITQFWNSTNPSGWVFLGMSDLMAKGTYETVDGKLTSDVYHNWGKGEPNNANGIEDCVVMHIGGKLNDNQCSVKLPYICKKALKSLEWNYKCDLPDLNYIHNEQLGRCYKIHMTPLNWTEAYTVCRLERSYLAVINSDDEAQYLVGLLESSRTHNVKGVNVRDSIHLGFRNTVDEGWQTFTGAPLEATGYIKWADQKTDSSDQCGSMLISNGLLNPISCGRRSLFVCERDVSTTQLGDVAATLSTTY